MGATIVSDVAVAAYRKKNGTVLYELFFETYERGEAPWDGNWWCFYAGDARGAVKAIFSVAVDFESGALQRVQGPATPESFISEFLELMKHPVDIANVTLTVSISELAGSIEDIEGLLEKYGFHEDVQNLRTQETITFAIAQKGEMLAELVAKQLALAGDVFIYDNCKGVKNADLGYEPQSRSMEEDDLPAFLAVGDCYESILAQRGDGTWYCVGKSYQVVGDFIEHAWDAEVERPGNFESRIQAFRSAIRTAPRIPQGTKVFVDLRVEPPKTFDKKWFAEFQKKFSVTPREHGFEFIVPVNDPEHDSFGNVTFFPAECASWVLPGDS